MSATNAVVAQWGDAFLSLITDIYTMPLHRFSLSSEQDHTVLCVLQGSYGSCPWMNSLMWPFHSSTASTKALSKIMGNVNGAFH